MLHKPPGVACGQEAVMVSLGQEAEAVRGRHGSEPLAFPPRKGKARQRKQVKTG